MDYSVLEKSVLFSGVPAKNLRDDLECVSHHIQHYDKGETVFHLMEDANRIGAVCRHKRHSRMEARLTYPSGIPEN